MDAEGHDRCAGCCLHRLPSELLASIGAHFLGQPQPVARLARASCRLRSSLSDPEGRLLASRVSLAGRGALAEPLRRVHLPSVSEVCVDLQQTSGLLEVGDVERLVEGLGGRLPGAVGLTGLSVRLASFCKAGPAGMDRLRLRGAVWDSLVCGLHALAAHGQLRSLELSFVPIKLKEATRPVGRGHGEPHAEGAEGAEGTEGAEGAESLTFFQALAGLASLEELVLTHDDIFGDAALELAEALARMPRLRSVDLARNRISGKMMDHIAASLPPAAKMLGRDMQTAAP